MLRNVTSQYKTDLKTVFENQKQIKQGGKPLTKIEVESLINKICSKYDDAGWQEGNVTFEITSNSGKRYKVSLSENMEGNDLKIGKREITESGLISRRTTVTTIKKESIAVIKQQLIGFVGKMNMSHKSRTNINELIINLTDKVTQRLHDEISTAYEMDVKTAECKSAYSAIYSALFDSIKGNYDESTIQPTEKSQTTLEDILILVGEKSSKSLSEPNEINSIKWDDPYPDDY